MSILKYNWKALKSKSNEDIDKIRDYLINSYMLKGNLSNFLIENRWALKAYNAEPKDSYLINVEAFIRNSLKATKMEQLVYLDLASMRNVFTYYNTRGKGIYLPAWKVEKMYDIEKLKANRLLHIEENNIHFVYEQENEV